MVEYFQVLEYHKDMEDYKLQLPSGIVLQKSYLHDSSLKEYRKNDSNRFKLRKIDNLKPTSILIDNAEEWKAEEILDYGG